MRLSTKGRYAVRAMLALALHQQGSPLSLREISRREGISDKYLEQIFLRLKRAGLIKAVRGANGGYLLGRKPKEITLIEILEGVEGSLAPVFCLERKCDRATNCVARECWKKLHKVIKDFLSSWTLFDLCPQAKARKGFERRAVEIAFTGNPLNKRGEGCQS
jgi:Rrf2 family protein